MISRWPVDRTAGWLGVAFLITLLGSAAALSPPDEHAAVSTVATFYADHRSVIIVLQVVGFASCALLALFAWRLHTIDRGVAAPITFLVPVAALVWLRFRGYPRSSTVDARSCEERCTTTDVVLHFASVAIMRG